MKSPIVSIPVWVFIFNIQFCIKYDCIQINIVTKIMCTINDIMLKGKFYALWIPWLFEIMADRMIFSSTITFTYLC